MVRAGHLPVFAVALLMSATAQAQEPTAPAENDAGCQLHVWPGSDLRSSYHGWFHGGIVDGAVQGRDGYRQLPATPLSTATQSDKLRQLPLADLLGLPDYSVVMHDTPLDSRTLRTSVGRIVPNSATCYAELAVDDVFFQEDVINGRFLKALFRFRTFDAGDQPSRRFGSYVQQKLMLFPPAKPSDDLQPGLDELSAAFGKAVIAFGQALNKPPKVERRR